MRKKVSIIGAGNVGATTALYISELDIADVVLVDVVDGIAKGKALDFMESSPVRGFHVNITGISGYDEIANSDIVVVTAGLARKPGMTREDLLFRNAEIIAGITDQIKRKAPNCIIIMVTNPLDVMAYLAWKKSGFSHNKVIGMAGVLDSARLKYFISKELSISSKDIQALVLGGHGDSMVPLSRFCTVSGIPITKLMSEEKVNELNERTKNAGAEIVEFLKTGSAYYSPAASVAEMVETILKSTKRILPCGAYLSGEYGLKDIYIGVPVVLGPLGIDRVIELELTKEELNSLNSSAETILKSIKLIDTVI
ncbi:MAG: malate dehydrogenase [Candidatus Omnitrophica bacterium]|nr:malate dehydrogenase [Candidatus Omnitrophota bacterium]